MRDHVRVGATLAGTIVVLTACASHAFCCIDTIRSRNCVYVDIDVFVVHVYFCLDLHICFNFGMVHACVAICMVQYSRANWHGDDEWKYNIAGICMTTQVRANVNELRDSKPKLTAKIGDHVAFRLVIHQQVGQGGRTLVGTVAGISQRDLFVLVL